MTTDKAGAGARAAAGATERAGAGGGPVVRAAFLYRAEGADAAVDRVVRDGEIERSTIVAVPDGEAAARVVAELERGDGVDLVELYGGLGHRAAALVIEALGGRVPVGVVGYEGGGAGAAARVRSRAIVYEETNANPAGERVVAEHGHVRTTVVAVPSAERVPAAALALVDEGAEVIEICGGLGPVPAARTVAAIDGRVPVGAVLFGAESLQLVARYQARFDTAAD